MQHSGIGRRPITGLRNIALLVVAGLAVAACSAGDDDTVSTGSAEAPSTTVGGNDLVATPGSALADIELSVGETEPLDTVALVGLAPADTVDLELWLRSTGGDGDIAVPLYVNDDGAHFSAPPAPQAPRDGGPIELYLARDDERGPLLNLEVGSLKDAPGAWDGFVTGLVGAIDRQAQASGTSFAELQATDFDDVEAWLQPLKLAQAYADDGSDNDLESFYTYSELTDEDRSMLDALASQARLIDLVREPGRMAGFSSAAFVDTAPVIQTAAMTSSRPTAQSGDCIASGLTISGAQDLSDKMNEARANILEEGDARRQVLEDIGTVTTVGGFIPAVGWAVGGFGAGFISLQTYLNATAAMYPSSLSNLTAELTDDKFPEDFQAPNGWSKVMVTAKSKGWEADADVAKSLLSAASALTAGLSNLAKMSVADGVVLDVSLYLRDNAANAAVQANADSGGALSFCPEQWTVDVSGKPWSSGRAMLNLFSVDSEGQTFEPTETGMNLPVDDTLRIEVDGDQFGRAFAAAEFPISVKPINVTAADFVEVYNPGDDVEIEVSIRNALITKVEWTEDKGGWRGDDRLTVNGDMYGPPTKWVRTHVTASAERDFPYFVTIDSATDSGFRADGDPPRRTVVQVRLKELIVTPTDGRVLKGKTLPVFATDRDGRTVEVNWTATGGTIGTDGVYTAGNRVGTYTVTATSKANAELTTTVTVEVVEADCVVGEWRLREQDFLDQISALSGGVGTFTHVGGTYLVTFGEDGSYAGQRAAWEFAVFTEQGRLDINIDSVEGGTWIVDAAGERITVDETSSDATVTLAMNGVPLTGGAQNFNSPGFGGAGDFECDGAVMTMTVTDEAGTATSTLDRIG